MYDHYENNPNALSPRFDAQIRKWEYKHLNILLLKQINNFRAFKINLTNGNSQENEGESRIIDYFRFFR